MSCQKLGGYPSPAQSHNLIAHGGRVTRTFMLQHSFYNRADSSESNIVDFISARVPNASHKQSESIQDRRPP